MSTTKINSQISFIQHPTCNITREVKTWMYVSHIRAYISTNNKRFHKQILGNGRVNTKARFLLGLLKVAFYRRYYCAVLNISISLIEWTRTRHRNASTSFTKSFLLWLSLFFPGVLLITFVSSNIISCPPRRISVINGNFLLSKRRPRNDGAVLIRTGRRCSGFM